MQLRGKRWTYWVNGHRLYVDNAWSWSGWTQERVLLEGRTVASAGVDLSTDGGLNGGFELTPKETGFAQTLKIALRSGLFGMKCKVWFGDRLIKPEAVETANWQGRKGEWPDAGGASAAAQRP